MQKFFKNSIWEDTFYKKYAKMYIQLIESKELVPKMWEYIQEKYAIFSQITS